MASDSTIARNPNRKVGTYRRDSTPKPVKVPASSVPFGDSISRNGRYVWVVMEGGRVVAIGATADEAGRKYKRNRFNEMGDGSKS